MTPLPPAGIYCPSLMLGGFLCVLWLAPRTSQAAGEGCAELSVPWQGSLGSSLILMARVLLPQSWLKLVTPFCAFFPHYQLSPSRGPMGEVAGAHPIPWYKWLLFLPPQTSQAIAPGWLVVLPKPAAGPTRQWQSWECRVGEPAPSACNQLHGVHVKYLFLTL